MGFLDRFFQPKTMSITNTPEVNEEEIREQTRQQERQQAAEWLARSGMREPQPDEVSEMDMNEPEREMQEQRQMASEIEEYNYPVAATMFAEGRGEEEDSLTAMFNTVQNRSNIKGQPWASTIQEPSQYTGHSDPNYASAMQQLRGEGGLSEEDAEKLELIKRIMNQSPADTTNNSTHYYNPTLQAELHQTKPDLYPETPDFAFPETGSTYQGMIGPQKYFSNVKPFIPRNIENRY